MFFVVIGWLLFVFEELPAGLSWLSNMFGVGVFSFVSGADLWQLVRNLPFLIILGVASTPLPKKLYKKFTASDAGMTIASAGGILVLILCIAYLVDSSFNPFLYFRF